MGKKEGARVIRQRGEEKAEKRRRGNEMEWSAGNRGGVRRGGMGRRSKKK